MKVTERDNNYAVTTAQMAEALERSAGSAQVYGASLERTIGYATSIGEVTRESGSVIGNSLKSIMSRITSVPGAIKALDEIGISVKNSADEMRNFDDIIDDLGSQWSQLSNEQKQNLGLQIAGRYQLSRFLIMMERYENVLEATETATNSQGSAMRENERYMDSYEAKINLMRNAWTETTISMQEAFIGDAIVAFTSVTTSAIKNFTKLVETFGLLPPVFALAGVALLGFTKNLQFLDLRRIHASFMAFITSLRGMSTSVTINQAGLATWAVTSRVATAAATAQAWAVRGLTAAWHLFSATVLPMAIFAGIGFAISKITEKMVESRQRAEELREKLGEFKELNIGAVTTNKEQVEDLLDTYRRLDIERPESGFENVEKEREYLQIQNSLAELFPSIISHLDSKGNAHLKNAEAIQEEISRAEKLAEAERKLRIAEAKETFKEDLKNIREYQKEIENLQAQLAYFEKHGDSFINTIFDKLIGRDTEEVLENTIQKLESSIIIEGYGLTESARQMAETVVDIFNDMTYDISQSVPQITDIMQGAIRSINFEEMDDDEIDRVVTKLSGFAHELENFYSTGQSKEFDRVIRDLNHYLERDLDVGSVNLLEISYEKLMEIIQKGIDTTQLAALAHNENSEAMDNAAESADNLSDAQRDLLDAYDNSISKIEDYNRILDELDGDGLSAKSISTIMEKYQEFLPYLDDEISLRRVLKEAIEEEAQAAEESIIDQMMQSKEFFDYSVENNKKLYEYLAKLYNEDYDNFESLAHAKGETEEKLIKEIAGAWAKFYRINSKGLAEFNYEAMEMFSGIEENNPFFGKSEAFTVWGAMNRNLNDLNKELKDMQLHFESAEAGINIDLSGISASIRDVGKSNKKAAKSAKDTAKSAKDAAKEHKLSAFVADTYAKALEKINSQLQRQKDLTSEFPKHSKEYRKSLEAEIELLKTKSDLIESQSKELARQIKSGNIQQTGIVDSGSVWSGGGSSSNVGKYYLENFRVTSGFGRRTAPTAGASTYHKGIDLARGRAGDPVKALASGKVLNAYYSKSAGYMVTLQQDDGIVSKYMHMQPGLNVKAGQRVQAGQQLGRVGNTGYSTGPHLHLQLERNGVAFDPMSYLKGSGSGKSAAQIKSEASRAEAQRQSDIDRAMSDLLRMEDEAVSIKNEINRLFFEIVESFLEEFDHNRNKLNKRLAKIDYYQLRYDEGSQTWTKYQLQREEVLRKQNKIHKDSIKWLEKEIRNNKNLTKAQKMRLDDKLIERQQEMWNLERTILDERVKMANQLMDIYKQALNAQKDATVKMIDEMIKEIDEAEREADYRKRLEKEQKSRQEILDEISQWSIDDSDRARKKLKELTEQLQELDETIEDMQHDKAIEDRKNALNEEKEAANERFDNLINDEKAFAKMRSDIIKGNTKSIAKELNSMFKEVGKMTEDLGKSVVSNLQRAIQQMNYYIQDPKFKNMKIPHFDTGGMVRASSSKGGLIVAHDKEIVLNKDDTKNLLDIVKTARNIPRDLLRNIKIPKLPSQPVVTTGGDTVYDIDLHVGSLSGTKDDARFVLGEIVKGVKKKGGRL